MPIYEITISQQITRTYTKSFEADNAEAAEEAARDDLDGMHYQHDLEDCDWITDGFDSADHDYEIEDCQLDEYADPDGIRERQTREAASHDRRADAARAADRAFTLKRAEASTALYAYCGSIGFMIGRITARAGSFTATIADQRLAHAARNGESSIAFASAREAEQWITTETNARAAFDANGALLDALEALPALPPGRP